MNLDNDDTADSGEELRQNRSEVEQEEDVLYLSLFHGAGKLGGAYYNLTDGILYVMDDMADPAPHFKLVLTVTAQLNPKRLLICSRHNEAFAKAAKDQMSEVTADESSLATETRSSNIEDSSIGDMSSVSRLEDVFQNIKIQVLPPKEFSLESCRRRVQSLKLPGETDQLSVEDHYLKINSLINPLNENMIRAVGALLKHLDKNQIGGLDLEGGGGVPILAVKPFTPQEVVRVDETTLSALQIFNQRWQNSGTRAGPWNQSREGLSIFNLLNKCKSVAGSRHLKYLLRCLPRTTSVIQSRQEAIAFFSQPTQLETMKVMQGALKKVKRVTVYLKRLTSNQATVTDWKTLKSSLSYMFSLGQLCHNTLAANPQAPFIIRQIAENCVLNDQLGTIVQYFERVFDIEESEENSRFVVKHGVDSSLDHKKKVHNGLPNLLFQLAQEEVDALPNCMKSCTMVYVPQLGYMLAVEPWPQMPQDKSKFDFPDLKFMFFANNVPHFKSQRCSELDESMGDTATNICDHETSIMLALSAFVLERSVLILDIAHSLCQLDCLLSLATVARENNWCRPDVVDQGSFLVKSGRHPLQEQCVDTFVSNDIGMLDSDEEIQPGKVIIMTGPNACGKSVYLKQIGIIAFLAHLGSWVPASVAQVPVLDAIYTRIQTTDSIALGLSAFAVDLNQMSMALNNGTGNSLVLIDEFGKGTSDVDGQALLAASLDFWISKPAIERPFIVVSTHFHSLKNLLQHHENRISYQTFLVKKEDNEMIYLYKAIHGSVAHSEANSVAKKAGIDEKLLERSSDILKCIAQGGELTTNLHLTCDFQALTNIIDAFQHSDLNEQNLQQIFNEINHIFDT